jgi:basic membrane protein A
VEVEGDDSAGQAAGSTEGGGGSEGAALRIAVVAPSATNDLAFTQSMSDALEVVGQERQLDVAFSENMFVVEDAAAAIRDYAAQGYDLVMAHGSQYGGAVEEIAPEFPEVSFAWGTAADTFGLDNVYGYQVAADEGGYAQGIMAAALSEGGLLGVVGPIETGDAALYTDGFTAGAKAENPSTTVNVNYIGSFSDVALAAEAAEGFVSADAKAMTGSAQMVVGAIGVAKERNIPWFSNDVDQSELAPEVVVSSAVYHWEIILRPMLDAIAQGTLGGEAYEINFENEGLTVEFNDGFDLPDDIRTKGDDAIQGIIDGEITTGATPEGATEAAS